MVGTNGRQVKRLMGDTSLGTSGHLGGRSIEAGPKYQIKGLGGCPSFKPKPVGDGSRKAAMGCWEQVLR